MRRSTAALVVAVSALVLFVAVSYTTAQEEDSEIEILLPTEGYDILEEGKPEPCCNRCICTRSKPPRCQCTDILLKHCHPGCKKCVCTKSFPAKCRCLDIKPFCGPHCPPKFD